ncbi:type II secretory pathway pseudopilin PulG [Rathayibacter agropyri]
MNKYYPSSLRTRSENGFTTIELVAIFLVMAVIAAIAIPIFSEQQKLAIGATLKADTRSSVAEVASYLAKNPRATDLSVVRPVATADNQVRVFGSWDNHKVCAFNENGSPSWSLYDSTGTTADEQFTSGDTATAGICRAAALPVPTEPEPSPTPDPVALPTNPPTPTTPQTPEQPGNPTIPVECVVGTPWEVVDEGLRGQIKNVMGIQNRELDLCDAPKLTNEQSQQLVWMNVRTPSGLEKAVNATQIKDYYSYEMTDTTGFENITENIGDLGLTGTQLTDLHGFVNLKRTGGLSVGASEPLSEAYLPNLEEVTDQLSLNYQESEEQPFKVLNLPKLRSAGNVDLWVFERTVSLPSLVSVANFEANTRANSNLILNGALKATGSFHVMTQQGDDNQTIGHAWTAADYVNGQFEWNFTS